MTTNERASGEQASGEKASIEIDGVTIAYTLLGKVGDPAVAITPGGRFSKDAPGVPELGAKLAAAGKRVLLWDRPNTGESDICFNAVSESELNATTLIKLIRTLELGPTALAAGSAGSRVSLIAAARDPEIVSHLILWWISGGAISLITLAAYYSGNSAIAASHGGMAAVCQLPEWSEQLSRNPNNRDILLAQDPAQFIATMERWGVAYLPSDDTPVPGMTKADFQRLTMPVKILQNGLSDLSHTRATSEWVHRLIPQSQLVAPPWPDDEWNRRCSAAMVSGSGHFAGWPVLADDILSFIE